MAYVSKRDLIEKVRPLVDRLRQVAEEVESAVDQLNDLSRDMKRALSEVEVSGFEPPASRVQGGRSPS